MVLLCFQHLSKSHSLPIFLPPSSLCSCFHLDCCHLGSLPVVSTHLNAAEKRSGGKTDVLSNRVAGLVLGSVGVHGHLPGGYEYG